MNKIYYRSFLLLILTAGLNASLCSQEAKMDFHNPGLDLSRAKVVEHLGREALMGIIILESIDLGDCIINVDIATSNRTRSYPGVLFHVQDQSNYERVYVRPHRSPFYPDALQYAPMFNGVDSWQLYNGPGLTASLDILPDMWNHMKIVISGDVALIYWNDDTDPAMIIAGLAYGESSGGIGLNGPMDGTAYFSNLTWEKKSDLPIQSAVAKIHTPGIISEWELSEPFALQFAEFNSYSDKEINAKSEWRTVEADKSGMVDISRYYPRKFRAGDCIIAKTKITTERDTLMRFGFGYSDYITVFLNGKPIYFGNSAYTYRDRSFLGIVGYYDNIFLPLKTGENELLVQVGESSGGWAFCFRREDEIYMHPSLRKQLYNHYRKRHPYAFWFWIQ